MRGSRPHIDLVVSERSHRKLKGEVKAGDPSQGQPVMAIWIVVDSIVKREMSDETPGFAK